MNELDGTNLMCLFPGKHWGTSEDNITMVVAHWDTVKKSPGFDDNGSGMAALLEVARALGHSKCEFENSVVLAALDLEEVGTHGGIAFANDFLVEEILKDFNFPSIHGVIVLDSIMTYNETLGAQLLPQPYWDTFPETSQSIKDRGSKGDFIGTVLLSIYVQYIRNFVFPFFVIGLISRETDDSLTSLFHHHWKAQERHHQSNSSQHHIGAETFRLPPTIHDHVPDLQELQKYTLFLRSDHVRFWFVHREDYYASFPSIHVTDTGPSRGLMKDCYHNTCDNAAHNVSHHFASMDMLVKVTQTIIDLLLGRIHVFLTKYLSKVLMYIHR